MNSLNTFHTFTSFKLSKLLAFLLLSFLQLTFLSCGQSPILNKIEGTESGKAGVNLKYEESSEKLKMYNDLFEYYSQIYSPSKEIMAADYVPINFDSEYYDRLSKSNSPHTTHILASCIQYVNGDMEIFINPSTWNNYNDIQKEIIVLHELGHCILGKEHVPNDPYNIMYPSLMDFNYYITHKKNVLENLFSIN